MNAGNGIMYGGLLLAVLTAAAGTAHSRPVPGGYAPGADLCFLRQQEDAGLFRYLREIDPLIRTTPQDRGKGLMWWEPTWEPTLGGPRGLFDRDLYSRPASEVFDGPVSLLPWRFTGRANNRA